MALLDYVEVSDKFRLDLKEDKAHAFAFPCNMCVHRVGADTDEPCNSCGHNLNAENLDD